MRVTDGETDGIGVAYTSRVKMHNRPNWFTGLPITMQGEQTNSWTNTVGVFLVDQ